MLQLKKQKPDIRFLDDMKQVLADQEWAKKAQNFEAYYMYRKVKKKGSLKYNITIIPARMLADEFIKTKGHYHKAGHPEVYIVLEGHAIYLMQKPDPKNPDIIKDVFAFNVLLYHFNLST